jgi:isopentenyl-diphosphate Delta-isomerase
MKFADNGSEPLDVLDPQGEPTGAIKPRGEVHRIGLWHRTVHVWIVNSKNQLLLQKRSQAKESHPGLWDISAAGHITAGDESKTAAIRELKEELGIDAEASELEYLFTVNQHFEDRSKPFIDNEITDIYLLRKDLDIGCVSINKEELDEIKLVGTESLKRELQKSPEEFVEHDEEYRKLFDRLEVG